MKILTLKNGKELEVIREDNKYYYCNDTQFRRNNPDVAEIKEVVKESEEGFDKFPDFAEVEKELEEEQAFVEAMSEKPKKKSRKKSESKKEGE